MQKVFLLIGFGAIAATGQATGTVSDSGSPPDLHSRIALGDASLPPLTAEKTAITRRLPDDSFEHLFVEPPSRAKSNLDALGMVSIWQLQHGVPKAAQKALEAARDALRHGRTPEALNELQKAVSIDPGFVNAYDELGAVYVSTGDLNKAVDAFRNALDVDPHHRRALSNLCVILGKLGELEEASRIGQRALQVDPGNAGVHYVLAVGLMSTPGESALALHHLQRAASGVPMAHLLAAQLLIANGMREEARRHVKAYLAVASGDKVHGPPAEALLRQLQE